MPTLKRVEEQLPWPEKLGTERYLKGAFYTLRMGLFQQFVSVAGLILFYFIGGGGIFNYSLIGSTDEIRSCCVFRITSAVLAFFYVSGTTHIASFQLLMSDDAAWSRGFRSGSKLINYATTFDMSSALLQFVLFLHLAINYSPSTWAQFSQGGSEWLLCAFARLLHAISMLFYGHGFFLIEIYHDEGTSEMLGIAILISYIASGLIEAASFVFPGLLFSPIISGISVLMAFVWALAFEHELNSSSPHFHESELTNEVEAQVNQYARLSVPPE